MFVNTIRRVPSIGTQKYVKFLSIFSIVKFVLFSIFDWPLRFPSISEVLELFIHISLTRGVIKFVTTFSCIINLSFLLFFPVIKLFYFFQTIFHSILLHSFHCFFLESWIFNLSVSYDFPASFSIYHETPLFWSTSKLYITKKLD